MVETFSAYWKFLKKPQLLKLVNDKVMLWKDIFWLLALDFAIAGVVFLFNMKGLTIYDPSFLIYISSQLFSGLSMGYIRVKYGLGYSILLHGCFNAIAIPIAWVFS